MPAALMRPVELTDSNSDCVANAGGGDQTVALSEGVHCNVLSVMVALEAAINTALGGTWVDIYLDSSNKVVVKNLDPGGADQTLTIDWDGGGATTDTALRDMLGFTANLSIDPASSSTATATYTPQYCWFPTYETSDPESWTKEPNFSGARATDGTISGVTLTSDKYTRNIAWPVEWDYNAKITHGTTTYQQARCLEQFIIDVLAASPAEDTADGLNMKGCYYIHDISVYQGSSPTVALPTTAWGSGGIDFEYSSSPDRYVYTTPNPGDMPGFKASLDNQKTYQDISLTLHTATAPSWNQPT